MSVLWYFSREVRLYPYFWQAGTWIPA